MNSIPEYAFQRQGRVELALQAPLQVPRGLAMSDEQHLPRLAPSVDTADRFGDQAIRPSDVGGEGAVKRMGCVLIQQQLGRTSHSGFLVLATSSRGCAVAEQLTRPMQLPSRAAHSGA